MSLKRHYQKAHTVKSSRRWCRRPWRFRQDVPEWQRLQDAELRFMAQEHAAWVAGQKDARD